MKLSSLSPTSSSTRSNEPEACCHYPKLNRGKRGTGRGDGGHHSCAADGGSVTPEAIGGGSTALEASDIVQSARGSGSSLSKSRSHKRYCRHSPHTSAMARRRHPSPATKPLPATCSP
ncbi:Os11g0179200 [Oryza sativa Japonica Group]|uniref:Os11g0179200 protein n=1 Tax=Oryza sativa subsp. japonica TaxID=39947 RepID=A0A0N7KSI7_ORYSJ|nr:Os11g0179200 [Oryza sativa Japonica Group]